MHPLIQVNWINIQWVPVLTYSLGGIYAQLKNLISGFLSGVLRLFISSSPGSIISLHAWFPFQTLTLFHSQPFHKRPRNPMYRKQMAERIKNKDFWLNWLAPHIINRKEIIKSIVSVRRGQLQLTSLAAFLLKCLISFLLSFYGCEHPLRLWVMNCYCSTMFGFTEN